MQKSFWWWQCSDRYIISLPLPIYPFFPSLISFMLSVNVKHQVYLLSSVHRRYIGTHIHSTFLSGFFFKVLLWNSSSVGLSNDGPFPYFQGRPPSASAFLQAINGVMSFALDTHVVLSLKLSKNFLSSETQGICHGCCVRQNTRSFSLSLACSGQYIHKSLWMWIPFYFSLFVGSSVNAWGWWPVLGWLLCRESSHFLWFICVFVLCINCIALCVISTDVTRNNKGHNNWNMTRLR